MRCCMWQVADKMVLLGLRAAGYEYLCIDGAVACRAYFPAPRARCITLSPSLLSARPLHAVNMLDAALVRDRCAKRHRAPFGW